eukprot:3515542-Prymnesium_polylepis.1
MSTLFHINITNTREYHDLESAPPPSFDRAKLRAILRQFAVTLELLAGRTVRNFVSAPVQFVSREQNHPNRVPFDLAPPSS